jgi:hypothetical protein
MGRTVLRRAFTFEGDDTCTQEWIFTLEEAPEGLLVHDLEIIDREKRRGCRGHPQTIVALVRGRLLSALDTGALESAACERDLACGQVLAKCIRTLMDE